MKIPRLPFVFKIRVPARQADYEISLTKSKFQIKKGSVYFYTLPNLYKVKRRQPHNGQTSAYPA